MAKTKKSEKYNKIIMLMLQGVSTDEIAKQTGYSIGHIHNIFEELRNEYSVNSKVGIATTYLAERIKEVAEQINEIILITGGCKITPCSKPRQEFKKSQKKQKNKK